MLVTLTNKKIYFASKPIDFRMSINSLSEMVQENKNTTIFDGSIYVFYNKHKDKIKCLFWDKNGFVLYYKKLMNTKFKIKLMNGDLNNITADELEYIISGVEKKRLALDHKG